MKKLAFALMFALPMMFVSCGDDNNDPGTDPEPEVYVPVFTAPVLDWNADQDAIQTAVTAADLGLTLNAAASDAEQLFYKTLNPEDKNKNQLPYYLYNFDDLGLYAAQYDILSDYKDLFVEWLDGMYEVKYEPLEEEAAEGISTVYADAEGDDATFYVYLYENWDFKDKDGNVDFTCVMAKWTALEEPLIAVPVERKGLVTKRAKRVNRVRK